jgi:23S rRNA pseudouridine1911/1915/1917 synthase
MRVLTLPLSPDQHRNMCLSEFLPLWFEGKTPGDNPIARGLKYGIKPQYSIDKNQVADLVRKGLIYLNSTKVPHLPFQIRGKSKIILALPEEFLKQKSYVMTKNDIVFEDEFMIVINKPSGLPSQSTLNIFEDHALSSLMAYFIKKNTGIKSPYLNLMHRLDKDTSGLLMFSKKESANKFLTNLFEDRKIEKTYFAVSDAVVKNSDRKVQSDLLKSTNPSNSLDLNNLFVHQKFSVKGYIQKKPQPHMPFYFVLDPKDGLYSETNFEILKIENNKCYIACHPKTGRSHQIRVHLKHIGLPILGDNFYNPLSKHDRLMLHAWKLKLNHPKTNLELILTAAPPKSFEIISPEN